MPCATNADRAKIDGQYVKCCFGGSLNNAGYARGKIHWTFGIHEVNHQPPCSRATKWFHKCNGQRVYKRSIQPTECDCPGYTGNHVIHCARGPEHSYADEHGNKIRNDFDRNVKAFFSALDERIVNIDLSEQCEADKGSKQAEQDDIAKKPY